MAVKKAKKKVSKSTKTKSKKPIKARKSIVKRTAKVRKTVVKRTEKPQVVAVKKESQGKPVGKVSHFFGNISVAVIELSGTLKEGDMIKIKGATSDFEQKVASMQIEHDKVDEAKKGQSIGLKVKKHARQNDAVYKL